MSPWALLLGFLCLWHLALANSNGSRFFDGVNIMERQGNDLKSWNGEQHENIIHRREIFPYTIEVIQTVVPKLLEEKVVGNTKELSYLITFHGIRYVLHLVHNPLLISSDFKVFSFHKNKELYFYEPHIQTKCYYHGYIEDYPNSSVAINVCSGLRGTIHRDEFTYVMEPDGPLEGFSHSIYQAEASASYVQCDLNTSGMADMRPRMDNIHVQETKRRRTAYVELFMVISQLQFQFHNENATTLIESILELINNVNTVFLPLNTQIVLVGIEIWSSGDRINTRRENAAEILSDFLNWKKTLDHRVNYDVVVLSMRENTISSSGLARYAGACSPNNAAFISLMNQEKLVLSSAVFVHELGHVLGMKHDTSGCSCQPGKAACVMVERGLVLVRFSDCSVEDLETFYASERASCLWNLPTSDISSLEAECGNKVLEPWEECDCGSVKECESNLCCNPLTCKLRENVTCVSGPCCHNCKVMAEGTPCRIPSTECDLAEYCDGKSSTCPLDVYKQNGSPCNDGQSVCFEKTCYDYTEHCQMFFGKGAAVAPLSCFQYVNTVRSWFGNCNADGKSNIRDVMCGRLQCLNEKNYHPHYKHTFIITTSVDNSLCWSLYFPNRTWPYDPGAVPDGALCDEGKICLHGKCVDIAEIGYDCDPKMKCSGNGVCNSRKNCHCNVEWAPPHCNTSGYGGSVDSGPLTKNSFIRYILLKEVQSNASGVMRCCGGSQMLMILFCHGFYITFFYIHNYYFLK